MVDHERLKDFIRVVSNVGWMSGNSRLKRWRATEDNSNSKFRFWRETFRRERSDDRCEKKKN